MTPMMPPGQPMPPMEPEGMGGPMPMQPPMGGMPPPQEEPQEDSAADFQEDMAERIMDYALAEANIAKKYKNKKTKNDTPVLEVIGNKVVEGFEADLRSVEPWLKNQRDGIEIATLMVKHRTFPWPDSSNIKYPLVATAAMQFAARAYPSLVPNDGMVVKARVVGEDPDGSRADRAGRIAKHMSYQFMYQMPNWEEDMDKLCMLNAIIGTTFKRTWCSEGVVHSELVPADRLIINYYASDLESAYRKTEICYYTKNELLEKINNDEEFLDILEDIGEPTTHLITTSDKLSKDRGAQLNDSGVVDAAVPYEFLVQHTFHDLDNDGYEEPYIIVVHYATRKVVKITARWQSDKVYKNDKDKIYRIEPLEYYTKFGFIPNPDSNIYDIGFGVLLGPVNAAIDTLINQLVDAGTLANMQSGFIAKGLRIKMGEVSFRPGEWKVANATGEEMKSGIVPLPIREPSSVLLQLAQMLITSGNQLASVAEIFTGKMPGQNTPATTTQETVEQGMKVFTAIYKRLYRSLYREFKKVYNLNRINPDIVEEQSKILNIPLTASDYDGPEDDIVPSADPTGDSTATRMMKLQQVGQLLIPLGTVNVPAFSMRVAQGLEVPNPQELIQPPPPPQPDPNVAKVQAETQAMQQESQMKMALEQQKLQTQKEIAQMKISMEQMKMAMEQQKMQMDLQNTQAEARLKHMMAQVDGQVKMQQAQQDMAVSRVQAQQDIQLSKQTGEQKIRQQEESHKMKLRQAKQVEANKRPNQPRSKKSK